MEPCAQKITRKNNPVLVDIVFRLMFEILWVPSYDRRKNDPLIREFEYNARTAANRLVATDLGTASRDVVDEVRYAVECLVVSIERLRAVGLLPAERCDEALAQARMVAMRVAEAAACPVE